MKLVLKIYKYSIIMFSTKPEEILPSLNGKTIAKIQQQSGRMFDANGISARSCVLNLLLEKIYNLRMYDENTFNLKSSEK